MKEIKNILLPIDFSEASSTLLQYGVYLADKYDALLFLVNVAEDLFTYSGLPFTDYEGLPLTDIPFNQLEEDMTKHAQKRMDHFLEKDMADVSVDYEGTVLFGLVAEEIIRYAEEKNIDLIIIGTHGFKGLDRMLLGSVAEKVVKLAPCAVMTINAYKKRGSKKSGRHQNS